MLILHSLSESIAYLDGFMLSDLSGYPFLTKEIRKTWPPWKTQTSHSVHTKTTRVLCFKNSGFFQQYHWPENTEHSYPLAKFNLVNR